VLTVAGDERGTLRQRKISEWEKKIRLLHDKYPRLEEISSLHAKMAMELAFLELGRAKLGMSREELQGALQSLQEEKKRIIKEQNLPDNIYEILWDCPLCQDTGFVAPGEKCSCLINAEIGKRWQDSGLSPEQEQQTFSSFALDYYQDYKRFANILESCSEFAQKIAKDEAVDNLVLSGAVGTGKTHLCSAVANYLIQNGKAVIYLRSGKLLDLIREYKYNFDKEIPVSNKQSLQLLYQVPLLIIDDLGTESITEFAQEQLLNIIDERYNHKLPWLISTNIQPNDIGKIYEKRLSDRIMGYSRILKFVGDSVRLKKKLSSQE